MDKDYNNHIAFHNHEGSDDGSFDSLWSRVTPSKSESEGTRLALPEYEDRDCENEGVEDAKIPAYPPVADLNNRLLAVQEHQYDYSDSGDGDADENCGDNVGALTSDLRGGGGLGQVDALSSLRGTSQRALTSFTAVALNGSFDTAPTTTDGTHAGITPPRADFMQNSGSASGIGLDHHLQRKIPPKSGRRKVRRRGHRDGGGKDASNKQKYRRRPRQTREQPCAMSPDDVACVPSSMGDSSMGPVDSLSRTSVPRTRSRIQVTIILILTLIILASAAVLYVGNFGLDLPPSVITAKAKEWSEGNSFRAVEGNSFFERGSEILSSETPIAQPEPTPSDPLPVDTLSSESLSSEAPSSAPTTNPTAAPIESTPSPTVPKPPPPPPTPPPQKLSTPSPTVSTPSPVVLVTSPEPSSSPTEWVPTFYPTKFPTSPPSASPSKAPTLSPTRQTVTFFAMGGYPYDDDEFTSMEKHMAEIPKDDPTAHLVVHVGDIQDSDLSNCVEGVYRRVRAVLETSPLPVFVTPGERDYVECPDMEEARWYWDSYMFGLERFWRKQNFNNPETSSRITYQFDVQRQRLRRENWAVIFDRVLFIGVNVMGGQVLSQTEWNGRLADNVDWVREQLAINWGKIRALVVFGHGYPRGRNVGFFEPFAIDVATLGLPSLYVNGDGQEYSLSKGELAPNLWICQVDRGGSAPPLRIVYQDDLEEPFLFDRRLS